jgi:RimJ/RimL family protein N-acetyltransferase
MSEYGEVADVVYHLVYLKPENECGDSSGSVEYIGFVCMSFRSEVNWPDLGYALFEQYTGKGYASAAGKAVVEWWRNEVGVKDIWLGAADDNLASQRCARRIGFAEGGELRIRFEGGEEGVRKGRAFVLPGMKWPEYGLEIYVTLKKE